MTPKHSCSQNIPENGRCPVPPGEAGSVPPGVVDSAPPGTPDPSSPGAPLSPPHSRTGSAPPVTPDHRQRIRLDVIGAQKTREAVMTELSREPLLFYQFMALNETLRTQFLEFCMGVRGLQVSYDAVFKHIFDPSGHPDRLNEFLSLCIGQEVRIFKVLPHESMRLSDETSQVIMDIVVQFTDGSLASVEIQRNGYKFPGARCACYSSDMIVRQYLQLKEDCKRKNIPFTYQMLRRVYTIVLIRNSPRVFGKYPDTCIHRARQRFDSGLELDLLQEYILIPLDIFFENRHNKERGKQPPDRLDAWLSFIGSDDPEDILDVIQTWPDFAELYQDVFWFRDHRKELINVYSSVLSEYDRNTVFEMIEDYKAEVAEAKAAIAEKDSAIAEMGSSIAEKDSAIAEKDSRIRELEALLRSLGKLPD